MQHRFWNMMVIVSIAAGMSLATACKPTYPKCENDQHCKEKGEVCINGQCQECRDDAQCTTKYPNERRQCNNGRCEVKPECSIDADCASAGPGLVCKSSKCVPECAQDTDCSAGKRCMQQKCIANTSCNQDVDCGPNRYCVNNECSDQPANPTRASDDCRPLDPAAGDIIALDKVYFEFNKYELTQEARDTLNRELACLKKAPKKLRIVVEGHADDRGTQEYNLALGEKRANVVLKYLIGLGADVKRMKTRSKGKNEPLCQEATEECWGKNRRVQFIQSMK